MPLCRIELFVPLAGQSSFIKHGFELMPYIIQDDGLGAGIGMKPIILEPFGTVFQTVEHQGDQRYPELVGKILVGLLQTQVVLYAIIAGQLNADK